MGIGDLISKVFGKPKKSGEKSNLAKTDKHRRVNAPDTEDISKLKTENIAGSKKKKSEDKSSSDAGDDKPLMKENNDNATGAVQSVSEAKVMDVLSNVYDPEIPIDIVNLGLIYDVNIEGGRIYVKMTMTAPGCPASGQITQEAKYLIEEIEGVSTADIEIVWDPPWDPGRMSEEAKQSLGYL